jgi:hypothetical protein
MTAGAGDETMIERRSHPRLKISRPAVFRNKSCGRLKVGTIVDLGLGGTRIESLYSLTTGQRLEIAIAFLTAIMKFRGRVVYTLVLETGNTQAGIRFDDMPACERDYLGRYMGHLVQDKMTTNGARNERRKTLREKP